MADFKPQTQTTTTISGISLTKFNTDGSVSNVPGDTPTTVHSQAYVAGSFENLVIVSVSGSALAKYTLRINASIIDTRRTTPQRNLTFDFSGAPFELVVGDIVDVRAEHFGAGLETFEATIYGYEN